MSSCASSIATLTCAGSVCSTTCACPRLTWDEAMDRDGVHKPDTRFDLLLHDITEIARNSGFRVFSETVAGGGVVKAICVQGGDDLTRSDIEGRLLDIARAAKARGL